MKKAFKIAGHFKSARRGLLAAGLATGLLLAGCATTGTNVGSDDLVRADQLIRSGTAGWNVAIKPSQAEIRLNELLQVEVSSARPGYVYLFQMRTDNRRLNSVFPNAIDGANYMNTPSMSLPRPTWQMRATGPAGLAYYVAVVTEQPQDLLALMANVNEASKPLAITGSYGAAIVSVREN
jgi:Domain of unknown function (DUF4384)